MRMQSYDTGAPKRPVNLTLNADIVAQAEGPNLPAPAEEAVTAALARTARASFDAEVALACQVHDRYLTKYGSLGEAVKTGELDETSEFVHRTQNIR
jgi:hypothetical protein